MKPYIGITGFMQRSEVEQVLKPLAGRMRDRQLMIGALVSKKTLSGQPNKYPNRYPPVERIANIFTDHPDVLNLIHFASDTPLTLGSDLERLTRLGGANLDGFQLNMPWPDPAAIAHHISWNPTHRMVLQLGAGTLLALEYVEHQQLEDELEKLQAYRATDLLIDASAGKGTPFDPVRSLELLRILRGVHAPALAGGLNAETAPKLASVFAEFPELSVDAESGLRDAQDKLDVARAIAYVEAVLELL